MSLSDDLDSQINAVLGDNSFVLDDTQDFHYLFLLQQIAIFSAGRLNANPSFLSQRLADPEQGPPLRMQLTSAWCEKKYQSIREIGYLQQSQSSLVTPSYSSVSSNEADATERAWRVDYTGEAANALLDHIKDYLPNAEVVTTDDSQRQLYARCMAIIQSSGMGKSRTVDEMAKSALIIPMVLRPDHSSGYPPADLRVRHYLMDPTPEEFFYRMLAFMQAMFDEITAVVKGTNILLDGLPPLNKSKPLPPQFREYMNHNMTMKGHGEFRKQFYNGVIERAYQLLSEYKNIGTKGTPSNVDEKTKDPSFPLNVSCKELLKAIKPFPRSPPFIILAFDEIQTLGKRYIDFRRALRVLLQHPVFSISLSTSGHMYQFLPSQTHDPSARVVASGIMIPPFCELGFDHFAGNNNLLWNQDVMDVGVNLSEVSSDPHMVRFGRALWATRYDLGDPTLKAEIVIFAATKLMGGALPARGIPLGLPIQLSCLAQRLPIEFYSISYSSGLANPQTLLVQSHLRVVIRLDRESETMITASSSEPVLSEAAYWLMHTHQIKPATALKDILGGFSVDSGNCGELIVLLLLILARDKAVGVPNQFGFPQHGHRWCRLKTFLSSLFVDEGWDTATANWKSSMEGLLRDSKVYFSHFIKIHESSMLSVQCLMRLMARGAAILYGTSQKGVDLAIPFILEGDELREGNIGVVLIQVKNNKDYKADPMPKEFEGMSMRGQSDIPTLRFFFALAAKTSRIIPVPASSYPPKTLDFWVAGLSSDTLLPVKDEGDEIWKGLLNASYGWNEIYVEHGRSNRKKLNRLTDLRRSMYPGGASSSAHWDCWSDVPLL